MFLAITVRASACTV